uniref:putative receptor-like protein kinase At4g00960 n=1 Tax=Fragaria vesca subsp. vesca TaxID=101020 RepID=UPI0005CB3F56|nr:PREDICTED: putative receptor-like protein kinase At4g00960 [Fragaria vesca subsp. vesca]
MVFIIILLLMPTTITGADLLYKYCPDTTHARYNADSPFENNLKLLLESLSSNTSISDGFYNDTIGNSPDQVYGQALCRGDVNSTVCQSCVHDASQEIFKGCKHQEAIIWYELCQVHYSNIIFFSTMEYYGKYPEKNKLKKNVSQPNQFVNVLTNLMTNLLDQTAFTSKRMFATGDMKVSGNQSIYGLQQCTRDIIRSECLNCLKSALPELQGCCSTHEGGTIVSRNCNVRFELYRFFNEGNKRKTWKVVIICVSTILSAVFIVLCAVYLKRGRRRRLENVQDEERSQHGLLPELLNPTSVTIIEENKMVSSEELPFIDLATIKDATDDFSDSNKLGQGGFGAVYKGWLDGKEVAIKRLSRKSWQGIEEFRNEVTLIAKLQHRNLVRLLACGFGGEEKLLLYEFMPNKSLDTFIFDLKRRVELNWQTYHNIIEGIARGLLYLHEDSRLKIIHRDLKPSNVLLDHEMVPKISDFGMARIFCDNQNTANTTRVVGTHGYMAPEYAMEGLFSVKSDVFSFGVVLLEILSGKKNSGFYLTEHAKTLVEYAWTLWKDGKGSEFVEPLLMERCPKEEVLKYLQIALLCVQEDPEERPTMSAVVVLLGNDDSIGLPEPKKPAIFAIGRVAPMTMSTQNPSSNGLTLSGISPR